MNLEEATRGVRHTHAEDAALSQEERSEMRLTQPERLQVIAALDRLGSALADHEHQWTPEERAAYEDAMRLLGAEA